MIANSFLNSSINNNSKKTTNEEIDSLNSGRISGLSQELHAEISTMQVSRARQANFSGLKNKTEMPGSEGLTTDNATQKKIKPLQHVSMVVNNIGKLKEGSI